MPAGSVRTHEDEQAWDRAKTATRKQYPNLTEENDRFWRIVQSIYQNMKAYEDDDTEVLDKATTPRFVVTKAYVRSHSRKLPSGRTVTIPAYFTKKVPKGEEVKPGRTRAVKQPPPRGVHTGMTPEHLAHRLVRHVQEGTMTHEDAHANLAHLERRAHAGHGLEHGHGPAWTAEHVHQFIGHARAGLQAHKEAQEKQQVDGDRQHQATLDKVERDLGIEERKTASAERDTARLKEMTADETDGDGDTIENVLHITGNTYPVRRELRNLGAVWNADEKAYLVHPGKDPQFHVFDILRDRYKGQYKLDFNRKPAPSSAFEALTGEALRAYRQGQLTKKIELWRQHAARLDAQGQAIDARLKPYDDYAFWTEPIKIGHHSEQRHRRLRERLSTLMDKKLDLWKQARDLRDRADRLERQGATIKGDAAQRREERREQVKTSGVGVGSRIHNAIYGNGVVTKVNKNTYTVRFDQGHSTTVDQAHVTPTGEKIDPALLKEQTKPKFQRGQRVRYNHIGQDREGVITRVGPNRYTVKNDAGFEVQVDPARVFPLDTAAKSLRLIVNKAYVRSHSRKLPSGRTVTIPAYFTKKVPKGEAVKPGRSRAVKQPPPRGVHTGMTPEHLEHRLVRHVQEGTMSHEEAHANLLHLERRAHAGHGLEHGHGPAWTAEHVHQFIGHARAGLQAHKEAQGREKQAHQERQRQAETQAELRRKQAGGELEPPPRQQGQETHPSAKLVEAGVDRYRREGERGLAWWYHRELTAEDRASITDWLVATKHPSASEPGSQENRLTGVVREMARQRPTGQERKPVGLTHQEQQQEWDARMRQKQQAEREKPQGQAGATKELWQQTRAEAGIGERPDIPERPGSLQHLYGKQGPTQEQRAAWQQQRAAYRRALEVAHERFERVNAHHAAVLEAHRAGKPVPAHVLAEYGLPQQQAQPRQARGARHRANAQALLEQRRQRQAVAKALPRCVIYVRAS